MRYNNLSGRPAKDIMEFFLTERDFFVTSVPGRRRRRQVATAGRFPYRYWWETPLYTRNPYSTKIKCSTDFIQGRLIGGEYGPD
jgi:hypothetical protein